MLFEFEATGKNIEKAIENALFELKAIRDDVDIKILEQGGLFKKARVLVSISEDAREKYAKREQVKSVEEINDIEESVEEIIEEVKEEVQEVIEEVVEEIQEISKEEKKQVKEEEKIAKKAEKEEIKRVKKNEKLTAEKFLEGFVKVSGYGNEVTAVRNSEEVRIVIGGEKASDLIGYRGECMNALQYISSVIENADKKTRVILDIEGYRERREETLKALAQRMAKKVLKTGKSAKLEPMCANDRRIIHTELSEVEGVSTISKGTEPNRYLIVIPEKKD